MSCVMHIDILRWWPAHRHMICCQWHRWQFIWIFISLSMQLSRVESWVPFLWGNRVHSGEQCFYRVLSFTAFSGQADARQTSELSNNILTRTSEWLSVSQSDAGDSVVWCEVAVTLSGENLLLIWITMMSCFEKCMQQIAQFLILLDLTAAFDTVDHPI